MKTNRVTLAALFCFVMIALAASTAGAQITDPGHIGGTACSPVARSDGGFQRAVAATPWHSTVFALRNGFLQFVPSFRVNSVIPVQTARVVTRSSVRQARR